MKEDFLNQKLQERKDQHSLRELLMPGTGIDFFSNDYLGVVKNQLLETYLLGSGQPGRPLKHGSTGSRLLAGNYSMVEEAENIISTFHQSQAGLIFNSGYDANIGLLSCIPRREDTIIYDYLSHASIRDGIRLSLAHSFSFRHNDLGDLEKKMQAASGQVFVVTESVFSMDGDMAPLAEMSALCRKFGALLIVDEAHATGVVGDRGEGLVQFLGLQQQCFARVHTFGKALGCHGAIILGSHSLRNYLINYSRPFIYTTALPESSVAAISAAYALFPSMVQQRSHIGALISQFQEADLPFERLHSITPVQGIIVPGNERVRQLSLKLQQAGIEARAILYPTVPKGSERLRLILHAHNSPEELRHLTEELVVRN